MTNKTADKGDGYDGYLSVFTWRYGSPEMREIFSEREKRANWRKVWLALAEAQYDLGLVTRKELESIRSKAGKENVDVEKAQVLERKIRHDLMAELRTFADQAKAGGGRLHLGATSMDIEDNADILLMSRALAVVERRLLDCLAALRSAVIKYKGVPCMAWTHLQPAEPTTFGYRFANYAQDLLLDLQFMRSVRTIFLKGKGIKGAVGTSASFKALLGTDALVEKQERAVMSSLGLEAFGVTTQTYPRKVDYAVLVLLGSIAQSCHKFGLDLRILQSPVFGELSEPIEKLQVGSSAMPFKRNPVSAERMCSLSRLVFAMQSVGFSNAANSVLERTLDDSAGRRVAIPEAFLAIDECLLILERLAGGVRVYPKMAERNLERFGPFAGTEALMMKLAEKGADRQKMHELIRMKSFAAWDEVMEGRPNPLVGLLERDRVVSSKVPAKEVRKLMDPANYVGDSKRRCETFVKEKLDPALAGLKGSGRVRGSEF